MSGIATVGDLRMALAAYPDSVPIRIEREHWYSDQTVSDIECVVLVSDLETRVVLSAGDEA